MPDYFPPFSLEIPIQQAEVYAIDHLADNCQKKHRQLSRQALKNAMSKGAVWLQHNQRTQRLRRAKRVLTIGDTLYLYYNQKLLNQEAIKAISVYQNQHYSVWNKPSGMPSQGSKWSDHCALTRWVEETEQQACYLVHRLDKAASGLILIAHNKKTTAQLCQQFEQRQVRKHYHAIVEGKLDEPLQERERVFESDLDGKPARTVARIIDYSSERHQSLLDIRIETGRKHQIRRHLAGAGHPIIGDRLHRMADKDSTIDLQLRAWKLGFQCPITREYCWFILNESQRLTFST